MSGRNMLTTAPPFPVDLSLKRLGARLRTARLRRNLTIQQVAEKIGTGPRPVSYAEKGRPSTAVAVYFALLWAYDLLEDAKQIADPALDSEGLALSRPRERARPREPDRLDNDF